MEASDKILLKCRFEKVPPSNAGVSQIEQIGAMAIQRVSALPWLVSGSVVGRAEMMAGGLLDPAAFGARSVSPPHRPHVRLRCIEDRSGPLVEYIYDGHGRIASVILLGTYREAITWSAEGRVANIGGAKSQGTQFEYHRGGLPSAIRYPGGARFEYSFDADGRLTRILYPDREAIRYTRGDKGEIVQAEFQDGVFEYVWGDSMALERVCFQGNSGTWPLNLKDVGKKLTIDLVASKSDSRANLASALGQWRCDSKGQLSAIWTVFAEPLRCQRSRRGIDIVSWSAAGQTAHRMDANETLDASLNPDGTMSLFQRRVSEQCVYVVSARGVTVLLYDDRGRLQATRALDGKGARYSYHRDGELSTVESQEERISFKWQDGVMQRIAIGNAVQASLFYSNNVLAQIRFWARAGLSGLTLDACVRAIWHWQVMKSVRRLADPAFSR